MHAIEHNAGMPTPPKVGDVRAAYQEVTMGEITNRATLRYYKDAEFHRRVDIAALTLEQEAQVLLDDHDRSIARQAIAVALTIEEMPGSLRAEAGLG